MMNSTALLSATPVFRLRHLVSRLTRPSCAWALAGALVCSMGTRVHAQSAYIKASNTGTLDGFGVSTAISGNTLVVGAWMESSGAAGVDGDQSDNSTQWAGAAYVFVRSGSGWTQQAYLKASNPGNNHRFGTSVSIFGDTIVVGAPNESSNATGVNGNQADTSLQAAGAAYVFVRTGATWTQQAYLKASNTGWQFLFGTSVSVSGDTIVVGAPHESSSDTGVNGPVDIAAAGAGAAFVFVRSGSTWTQQARLKASNTNAGDAFGQAVSIDADTVLVGAWVEDSQALGVNGDQLDNSSANAGACYVFVRNGTTWTQEAYLKASNTGPGDLFGGSTALSGDTAVIGASGEDSAATGAYGNQLDNLASSSGAAYVFIRNGTTWAQQGYLKPSNTGMIDEFGISIAVSGDRIVVGAHTEDSAETGVGGIGANDGAINSGAAYVFARSGIVWGQEAYLKASNTESGDLFGAACCVSGGTVVVGAHREDSGAVGVNGDQGDNSAAQSGAAYVYDFPLPVPYCFGDGSGASCPCGNQGAPGHGCANSANANGALLTGTGASSIAGDSLVLSGTGMPNSSALYFQGTGQTAGGAGVVFGDGLRCVNGTIVRLGTTTNTSGGSIYPSTSGPSVSVKGLVAAPGIRHYQCWYRNALAFCTPSTFNLTNGLRVTWVP